LGERYRRVIGPTTVSSSVMRTSSDLLIPRAFGITSPRS
jgi:hypothetical protein